jgi:hypothetical protein
MNNARQVVSLVFGCMLVLWTIRLVVGLLPRFRPRLRLEGSRMSVSTVATGIATFGFASAQALCSAFGIHFPKTLSVVAVGGGLILFCVLAVRDQYGGSAKI